MYRYIHDPDPVGRQARFEQRRRPTPVYSGGEPLVAWDGKRGVFIVGEGPKPRLGRRWLKRAAIALGILLAATYLVSLICQAALALSSSQ